MLRTIRGIGEPGAHQLTKPQSGKSRGSALEKALLVLDVVCEQPQPIGLPDIAIRVDLPRQTVHRILQQLEKSGLLSRDPVRERFMVGPHLSRLALSAMYSENHSAPARNILQELVDDVRETCNIGVLRGLDLLYVERIECDWPLRLNLASGSILPAHCVASGKVLLAHLPARTRSSLLNSTSLEPETRKTIVDVDEIQQECARVLERGYAIASEELYDGIIGISVPVLDASGRAMAGLAMHGPVSRLSEELAISCVPKLRNTAARLSQVWGLLGNGSDKAD